MCKKHMLFRILPIALTVVVGLIWYGCTRNPIQSVKTPDDQTVLFPDSLASDNGQREPIQTATGIYIQYPINPWTPLNGYVFGRYVSGRGIHLGDDCVRTPGTPVYAIWDGYVQYARYNTGGWGYLMIVEGMINNIPFAVVYGHLGSRMYPGEGQRVYKGQYIGTVGSTAESGQSSPHLHLGIKYLDYRTPTGQYPSWCKGYASSTSGWFNPTSFMAYW